jgi:hypothetical protein
MGYNAQLSSEQRNTKATALRHRHNTHRKPKLPRVANLLELFVMFYHKQLIYLAMNCFIERILRS